MIQEFFLAQYMFRELKSFHILGMWTPEVFYPMAKRCAFLRTLLKETAEAEARRPWPSHGHHGKWVSESGNSGTSRKIESV